MTIDTLTSLVPPPDEPVYSGSQQEWNAFQEKVGLTFPKDYYIVTSTYGSGRFLAGEFKVANPFDRDDEDFANLELTRLRETKNDYPNEVPYPLFPDSGGLYPFGIDGNGNTFLWKTNTTSDEWPIVCFNSEDYSEVVNHSLIKFLVLLASNQLDINRRKFWGSDFSDDHLEFVPRRVTTRRKRKTKK
jgi:hypothetical protein